MAARALHYNSGRQLAPFIPINCGALPENLLESELFGHCRGSFTGAFTDKKGLFEAAEGGTVFLDEVGSMSPLLQSRLLRVLQEREIRRIGDNTPIYVNVRVVAASNEPLEKMIKAGTFREDLYYRLNVIPLQLPSLRERRDDIPLLVAHFLKEKINARTRSGFQVSRQAMEALCAYDWPGNVRELENALERGATLCDGDVIGLADLPASMITAIGLSSATGSDTTIFPLPTPNAPVSGNNPLPADAQDLIPLKSYLKEQEHAYLNRVLQHCGGDKERAAHLLEISLATLYRKLAGDEKEP